jgi:Ca2+-binding EF-hand superfamily protein
VKALCAVIRRSVYQFIVKDDTLEEAWVCLLKAFRRFDPNETDKVSPRDFCLAVSVLIDGDDVVMTKEEWIEVIDYYTVAKRNAAAQPNQTMVDYMRFCENVLDPSEISQINPKDSALLQAASRSKVTTAVDEGPFSGLSGSGMNLSSRPQTSYAGNRNVMTQGQRSREAAKADTRNRFTDGTSKYLAWQDGFGEDELVTMEGLAPSTTTRPESRIEKMAGAHTTSASASGKKLIASLMNQLSSEQRNEVNAFREDILGNLKAVLAKSKSNKSMDALLDERLRAEDRNNSGSLSKQSLFAALHSLNVNPHAVACLTSGGKQEGKAKANGYLLEKLMKDDKVSVGDFVNLVFYK